MIEGWSYYPDAPFWEDDLTEEEREDLYEKEMEERFEIKREENENKTHER